ncbi:MAG: ribose-phosphate diphosphokinase [Patescibacteria group bacterium]
MKLIAGSSNLPLAQKLSEILSLPIANTHIDTFSNGEKRIWIDDNVAGQNVVVIQSFSNPVDSNIMETLLITDALERMGAKNVNLVIPWLGYSLQDKVFRKGEPIAAKVVSKIISESYVCRVLLLDLHNSSIGGFFSIPAEHLSTLSLFVEYVKKTVDINNSIVVSPDFGGLKRARVFANALGLGLANIDKQRDLSTGQVTANKISGDVQGKNVLIFDDIIVSGSTVVESGRILKENGAKKVLFLATHGLFTGKAIEKINNSQIDKVVISNSIHHPNLNSKIEVIDATPVFAEALKNWM